MSVKQSCSLSVRGLACLLIVILGAPPGQAADLLGEDLQAFTGLPADAAVELHEEELDDLRGMFAGFYFSVAFSGFAEVDGAVDGRLQVDVGFDGETGSLSFEGARGRERGTPAPIEGGSLVGRNPVVVRDNATGEGFRVQAQVGPAFDNARGAFLITQVPGNANNIASQLSINLVVLEATAQNVDAVRSRILGFPAR
ncbi:hypothetical protein KJ059_06830 [Myxococcota bacterium]|nr:hypothetical protein [Myxococcota bacterium]MCZ7620252.1 hypothetical protein [Myxococcota bacterium]